MSTSSLPSSLAPFFSRTPSHSAEPHQTERRIPLVDRLRARPNKDSVKKSRNSDAQLRLIAQENVTLPTYGAQGRIEGVVELFKLDNIISVDVKIEGRLLLKEIAEGGTTSAKICLATDVLWKKDSNNTPCPKSLPFSLDLPSTLKHENKIYPLPPTFDVKLSGLPGFHASVDVSIIFLERSALNNILRPKYAVTATITKPQPIHAPSRFPVKSTVLSGSTYESISTTFNYYPRSRPATQLPPPPIASLHGFIDTPDWTYHQSEIRSKDKSFESIKTKVYLPTCRIFCISQPIPFHVIFESSPHSLTSFLPLGPTVGSIKRNQVTQMQLMRQSTVDVRNAVIQGTKTDIWRIDCIGEGVFRHTANGSTWTAFSGEITINKTVHVMGFKVAGLSVKDCIVFSMSPPDQRSLFAELRQLIPVKLTTDPWVADDMGVGIMQHPDRKIEVENAPNPATPEQRARLPSENAPAPATRSYTVPQQASTSPGDGSEVHANQVPFKEQVIDFA
ncbi:hypothetical protein C0993_001634 [Termitomyces sp. T159_Od127]|nr:hypothetical protein C0993_001634 [Termitomyces sp. T159_Od127]